MRNDSTEFLVKTNKDVDEWMDVFYIEGRKADCRLHCQWTWQEQERRHQSIEAEMLAALEAILPFCPVTSASEGGASKYSANVVAADMVRAAISKAKGL